MKLFPKQSCQKEKISNIWKYSTQNETQEVETFGLSVDWKQRNIHELYGGLRSSAQRPPQRVFPDHLT